MTNNAKTLIACLTPPGRGAIATLGVRGPMAWSITRDRFRRILSRKGDANATAALPDEPVAGQSWFGLLGDQGQGGADEVVLFIKQIAPVPWLELNCHGGSEVVRLMQEQFQSRGAHPVAWSVLEGSQAPAWKVAAQEVLIQAPTVRTAAIALDQWHGAFGRAIQLAHAKWQTGDRTTARDILERLAALVGVGRHLVRPWRVVLAGAPNVGKSSLSNALAGYARSVVSPTPGTTRDVVTTTIALDGWPIEISDTAGLRDADERLEQSGMERARTAMASADLCLWLVDGAATPVLPAEPIDRMLLVINKTDLPPAWDRASMPAGLGVSAAMAVGLPELCAAIVQCLIPAPPAPGEPAPYTESTCSALEAIDTALRTGNPEAVTQTLARLVAEFA